MPFISPQLPSQKGLFNSILVCCIALLFFSSCSEPINEEEMDLLISVENYRDYGFNFQDRDNYYSKSSFQGITRLEYFIDIEGEEDDFLYLSNTISIEKNEEEAQKTYEIHKEDVEMWDIEARQITDLDSLFNYGDQSSFQLFHDEDGIPVGNILHCRKGRFTFQYVCTGVYFEDQQSWAEFILPELEKIDAYVQ